MRLNGINLDDAQLGEFCRKNGIVRLRAFGSILRDDFGPQSDIDLLADFDAGRHVSLFDLGGMLMELRSLLGREVDLRTPEDLSKYFRNSVLQYAKTVYAG